MKDCYVFDMDGTLCDVSSIRHLLLGETRDFTAFHNESINCPPTASVKRSMIEAQANGIPTVIVTARNEQFKHTTMIWCLENGITYDAIYFRRRDDHRQDRLVKEQIVEHMHHDGYRPVKAWDDNPAIIEMWKDFGIECVEVEGYLYA